MAQNSKDALFKSQVNNYISEKLSQSGTTPTFSVTEVTTGVYALSQFNGNVTLTTDGTNYIFTPQRGSAVTIAASSVTSITVEFITLNADASLLDGKTVTGSGIVSLTPFSTLPNADLSDVQSAVLSLSVTGGTSTPTTLDSLNIGSPTIGRIINISQGEVALNNTLAMPSNTAISVASGSNLTLTQTQASGASISGQYTINIVTDTTPPATISPTAFTFTDTGSSSMDGITSSGTITLALATDTASWQYSTDGGTTWTNGLGSSFTLSSGTYDTQNIKVKQFDGASFTGSSSISSMSTVLGTMQLEAIGVENETDYDPQMTAFPDGSFVVTFYGIDNDGDWSAFVQKFNPNGTTAGSMVQLEALGKTNGSDKYPQITALQNGEFAVTFYGYDSDGDYSIFVQKFNADGTTAGSMVQLEALNVTDDYDYDPQITALSNGEFAVTFYGYDSDGDTSIFVQKFNADGTTAGSMVQLEALNVTNGWDTGPQITALQNGEFAVTFDGKDSDGDDSIFVQKFNTDGTTAGSMVQLEALNVTNRSDYEPQITALSNGEFAVTFYGFDSAEDYSVFVQKFNADGTTTGNSMVKLEAINRTNGSDKYPQITALSNGEFAVTFSGTDSAGDSSIFVQKFNADGTTAGSMVQLEALNVTDNDDYDPQITALPNGSFVVVFPGNDYSSIFVQKFNADGTTAGSMVQLDGDNNGSFYDGYPQVVAVGTQGEFLVTFEGTEADESDVSVFVQRFNADGTPVNNVLIVDSTTPTAATTNPITNTDTNSDSNGVYLVGDKIIFTFSEPIDGTTLTLADITLNNSHSFGSGATLTALNSINGFASTFEITLGTTPTIAANDTLTIAASKAVDVAGNANSSEIAYTVPVMADVTSPAIIAPTAFTFSDTGNSATDGITSSGTITLTLATDTASWQYSTNSGTTWTNGLGSSFTLSNGTYDKQNIRVKQFDGADFTGNSSISFMGTIIGTMQLEAIGVENENDLDPQITALPDGSSIVTFYGIDSAGDSSIFVQKFNANGTTAGSMVQLEALNVTNRSDYEPQITALQNGEFAVTFYGYDSDGDYSIFVQKFNANGTTAGSMVQLEALNVTDDYDYDPQITALSNGEFAVTFYGYDSDVDTSIFVQKFNADGTTAGSMVQLEALNVTNDSDWEPQITALQNGEFAVTFYGYDSDGDYSIFVQKFNADGTTAGSMVQLEALNVTDDYDYDPQITALQNGEFAVTFHGADSAGDYSIFVQKFNTDGTTAGSMVQLEALNVTDDYDYDPQITALSNGEFAVTFYGYDSDVDTSIFVQKFNADGTTTGNGMVQLEAINKTNGTDQYPQITALSDGEFAVTFSGTDSAGDSSIFVQKFNADGTTTGNGMVQLEAINKTNGTDLYPQITALSDGSFIVIFYGTDSAGDNSIFVQKFNADGTPLGDTIVSGTTALVIDSTTPTAATTNPITNTDTNSDSTGVYAAGDKIAFAFSEPINATTLTLEDITLDNAHSLGTGATLTALNSSDGFASTFEITLGTSPTVAANDTLTIAASKAVDVAGNANSSGINYTVPAITAVATPTFTATNTSGVITFDGTATGNISLAIDSGIVTFTKGSVTAATTVALADITKITLAAGQTIADSAADLTKPIDGAGNVVVTGTAGDDVLYIYTSGTNSITGGAGSEMIWLGSETLGVANGGVDTMIIANGDSSVGTPDQIVYFELTRDKLDLLSTTIATTSTDVADVTVGGVTVGKTTITNGIATFQGADNATSVTITSADALGAALGYLSGAIIDTETVAFTYDLGSGNSGTYIFQGGATGDIVVDLIGVSVTGANLTAILI